MRRTWIWSSITCLWHVEWLSRAAWSAMAHAPIGAGVLVCAAVGWVAWERLPPAHADVPVVLPLVYVAPEKVLEPWGVAVLVVGIAGLIMIRQR